MDYALAEAEVRLDAAMVELTNQLVGTAKFTALSHGATCWRRVYYFYYYWNTNSAGAAI
jgi:hypothetical protein